MCVITSAAAAQNSIAKSRSLTASSEFSADRLETECLRYQRAIDRIGCACQRSRTERQAVDALACVEQATAVALEHFGVRQQVVAERHRLRHLHVRESRHHGGGVPLGELDQRVLQPVEQHSDPIDFAAQPQPGVGGDLIVARTAGVQPLAGVADQIGQALLDIQVDVFELDAPLELIRVRSLRESAAARARCRPGRRR